MQNCQNSPVLKNHPVGWDQTIHGVPEHDLAGEVKAKLRLVTWSYRRLSKKLPQKAIFSTFCSKKWNTELVSNTSSSKFYASELRTHLTTIARTTWKLCENHILKWQHHLASPLSPAEVLDRSKPVRIELDQPPRKNSPRVRTLQRCSMRYSVIYNMRTLQS